MTEINDSLALSHWHSQCQLNKKLNTVAQWKNVNVLQLYYWRCNIAEDSNQDSKRQRIFYDKNCLDLDRTGFDFAEDIVVSVVKTEMLWVTHSICEVWDVVTFIIIISIKSHHWLWWWSDSLWIEFLQNMDLASFEFSASATRFFGRNKS